MHLSGAWQRKLSVLHISCLAIDEYRALEQILMVYFHTMKDSVLWRTLNYGTNRRN